MRADVGELLSEVDTNEPFRALGTASWLPAPEVAKRLAYKADPKSSPIWLGENLDPSATPIGYHDDRHVCLVSGTRGGKGTGVIVPNLCLWPGSAVVIDPKGENATVTLRRRGAGSDYARGLGQKVCLLDPFNEVQLDDVPKGRYNPLDAIDPEGDFAIDDAARMAAAIIPRENKNDPYWEEAARNLVKGVVLHVLSFPEWAKKRNLNTVRELLTRGAAAAAARVDATEAENHERDVAAGKIGEDAPKPKATSPFTMLYRQMKRSKAFEGAVAVVGEQMLSMPDKMRSGVVEIARNNTEFMESRPMRRMLESSDFDLAELKTNPQGLTVFLVLPQRFMETHFRWLRLMTTLAVSEMERQKGRPQTGHRTLFLLDEFAGLKRMPVIEHAVSQAAGFGVKFFFVLQNFAQLKAEYEDAWETFVSNSGTRIFFQIDDQFTREYLSKQLGEQEVRRETRSVSTGQSASRSTSAGESTGVSRGTNLSESENESISRSYADWELQGRNRSLNRSGTEGSSEGDNYGTNFSTSGSMSASTTDNRSEGVHRRPLLHPDEIGRFLSRIDELDHPAFPGLMACLLPGRQPLLLRRANYFKTPAFAGLFDPHPLHDPPPTLLQRGTPAPVSAAATFLPPSAKPPDQILLPPPLPSSVPEPPPLPVPVPAAQAIAPPPLPPPLPPQVARPVAPAAELLQQMMTETPAIPVLPSPLPPPMPSKPLVRQPANHARKFSLGVLLPLLIIATGVYGISLWQDAEKVNAQQQAALHREMLTAVTRLMATSPHDAGYAARKNWEDWYNSPSGQAHDGAAFWAAERSVRAPRSCYDGPGQYSNDYRWGCLEAQRRLAPADQQRLSDPAFREGWNSY